MSIHHIEPDLRTLHGHFSRDLPPILTIASGDTVRYRTIDAGWNVFEHSDPFDQPEKFAGRDRERDPGHAIVGPVAVEGAEPGMTLEVFLKTIRPGSWGWTSAGFPNARNQHLALPPDGPEKVLRWSLDVESGSATNQYGQVVRMRPFMGLLGMPPAEPGRHSTVPPRFCGGNIDCKELVAGSRLFLPIPVAGGLFSIGDGHALQGDGEVAGPALECPMELVEVEFHLHRYTRLSMPRAQTPVGWITFGFDEDLNRAMFEALNNMLDLMQEIHGLERQEALALASLVVDLRITQIVNGVCGVHAILPYDALQTGA